MGLAMQPLATLGRRLAAVLAILTVTGLCGAGAAAAAEPVTVTNYTSKSQEMEWGYRSNWKQPWRSYMETVPAQTLLNAVGINFNVSSGWAASTAKLLGNSGFTRARIELGWDSVEYANPGKVTAAKQQSMRTTLTALKENGIRPLILLNSNSGAPCPVKADTVTLTGAASAGATEIHISTQDVSKVIAGRTGISDGGIAARYLFKSVAANGTVQLSQPLGKSLPAGTLAVATFRFEPFRAEALKGGRANPAFEETMQGWLSYVAAVTQEAKAILGSDQFDVEVWNELGFGSEFLSVENYYSPGIEEGREENQKAILARTIQYIRSPASGLPDVGIGDGFANERPWEAGSTSPVGLTAIDKHPYRGWIRFPEGPPNGNRPLNGLGQPAAAQMESSGQWRETWAPTYDAFFPEYYLSGIQTETLVHDLSPTPSIVGDSEHGRFTHPAGGAAPQVWITEVNLDPTEGPTKGLSSRDIEHIKAKNTLRYITSFANKGVTNIDFYAANDGNFSLINQGFFNALQSSPSKYPGDSLGGETMNAVRRLTATMKGAQSISSPRSLTDYEGKVQWGGDGSAANPPLYDRDVFAFLPFQVSSNRFVVPVYVMTRNVEKVYQAGSSEPSRFDLPAERYKLTIGGVDGASATVSATDPLSGETVPVEIVSRGSDQVTVEMGVTDSPRMLSIEDGGTPTQASPPEAPAATETTTPPQTQAGPSTGTETQQPETAPAVEAEAAAPPAAQSSGSPAPAPAPEPAPVPVTEAPSSPTAAPELRLRGGRGLLKKGKVRLIAHCRAQCKLSASGSVRVDGRSYRLASRPVASRGPGSLTIDLRLNPQAAQATRVAAEQGSEIEAVATVRTDGSGTADPTKQTVAAQLS
jgi:hypothetical protein